MKLQIIFCGRGRRNAAAKIICITTTDLTKQKTLWDLSNYLVAPYYVEIRLSRIKPNENDT